MCCVCSVDEEVSSCKVCNEEMSFLHTSAMALIRNQKVYPKSVRDHSFILFFPKELLFPGGRSEASSASACVAS